jgi:hypothetical protein
VARAEGQHSIDIPEYLWRMLDDMANFHNIPTNRMIAGWLWRQARREADSPDIPATLQERLLRLPRPYDRDMGGTREYSRRATNQR